MERVSEDGNKTLKMTGQTRACLNIGSYNYLGFADDWQTSCKDRVMPALETYHSCMCSSRMDLGTSRLHTELEELVARFVGKEAALVYNMGTFLRACVRRSVCRSVGRDGCASVGRRTWTGDTDRTFLSHLPINPHPHNPPQHPPGFGTNSTTIPALVGKGSLIISDTLNHTSIVNGCRASGAYVRTFHHNDCRSLERVLRDSIAR